MEGIYLLVTFAAALLILYVFHGLKDLLVISILVGGTAVIAFLFYIASISALMLISPTIAMFIALSVRHKRNVHIAAD